MVSLEVPLNQKLERDENSYYKWPHLGKQKADIRDNDYTWKRDTPAPAARTTKHCRTRKQPDLTTKTESRSRIPRLPL